jgi:hypothetical protein
MQWQASATVHAPPAQVRAGRSRVGRRQPEAGKERQKTPWASMASATLTKPLMLAPST